MEDKVLETVVNGLDFKVLKDVLVKPLEPIKVKKEITEQIPTGKVDKEGFNEYDTKTEVKEVESDFGRGIVLDIPEGIDVSFIVGDTIYYNKKFAKDFDVFKDSQLIKPYDIIAVVKK